MSRSNKTIWLAGAFAICLFAGGSILWRGSYREYMEGSGSYYWAILPLFTGAALALSWIVGVGIVPSALVVGSAFPAIVVVRVVIDGAQDPTAHNLWPFEVVLAMVTGMVMTFPAAAIGGLLRRLTHRGQPPGGKT